MENSPGDKGIVGTLEYLSPEYVQGRNSGWKRDVWAIGILAFEMLVGKSPFEGLKENEKWAKLVKVGFRIFRIPRVSIWLNLWSCKTSRASVQKRYRTLLARHCVTTKLVFQFRNCYSWKCFDDLFQSPKAIEINIMTAKILLCWTDLFILLLLFSLWQTMRLYY